MLKIGIYTEAIGDYISGGISCIVNVLNHLNRQGHDVCAFVDHKPYRSGWIPAAFPIYPRRSREFDQFDGFLISPFSPTAQAVANHANARDRFYWVHTNEALFCHNGKDWQNRAMDSYNLPLKIFCTSSYVQILMEQVYNRYVIGTLVPPGIDPLIFFEKDSLYSPGSLSVAMLCRPDWVRGYDTMIAACEYTLHALGSNHANRFAVQGIPNNTRDQSYIASWMRQCDIYLDASRVAGCPTPVKEAMACGAVPICTKYGTTDFILHGFNGFIVPPDDPVAIMNIMVELMRDHDENPLVEMRKNAINTAKSHRWNVVADNMIDAIMEGLERGDELLKKRKWITHA